MLGQVRDGEGPGRPPVPEPTLADVPELVSRVEAVGLPIRLRLDADLENPLPGVELAGYRVIQEALTNCLRHADASRADVLVSLGEGALRIEVRDDGTGAPGVTTAGGHGLDGMRERVSAYGGELVAGPCPEGGYRVSARIPLEPKADVA